VTHPDCGTEFDHSTFNRNWFENAIHRFDECRLDIIQMGWIDLKQDNKLVTANACDEVVGSEALA
jgi:hypothetical protein